MRAVNERRTEPILMEFEKRYLSDDMLQHDNANIIPSATSLMVFWEQDLLKKAIFDELMKVVPDAVKAHRDGWIYLHKLPENLLVPYSFHKDNCIIVKFRYIDYKDDPERYSSLHGYTGKRILNGSILVTTFERLWKILDYLGVPTVVTPDGHEVKKLDKFDIYCLTPKGFKKIITISRHKPRSKKFRMIQARGRLVLVTEDHPMVVIRDGRRLIVQAKDVIPLKDEVHVLTSSELKQAISNTKKRHISSIWQKLDPYIVGYVIGDGSIDGKHVTIYVGTKAKDEFLQHLNEMGLRCSMKVLKSDTEFRIILHNTYLPRSRPFSDLLKRKSHEKLLPEDFLLLSAEDRVKLLCGIIDSDGTVKVINHKGLHDIMIRVTSFALVQQISLLCRSLGIKSYTHYVGKYNNNKIVQRHDLWCVGFRIPEHLMDLFKKYSLKLRKYNVKPVVRSTADDAVVPVTMNYEVELEEDYVYDVQVESEDNTLYVNGIEVHNCGSIKTAAIVKHGLRTQMTVSRPPRHMDAAVDQLKRAVVAFSFERVGAVSLTDVAIYLAPFVRYDKLDHIGVKQNIQRFFFELNNIERPSSQSPFSNISLGIEYSDKLLSQLDVYCGGKLVGKASDFLDEALEVTKAIFEMHLEGDATGAPFTFPIVSILHSERTYKVIERDPELWETFWRTVAVRGQPYFLNLPEGTVYSFCCRLICDISKINDHWHVPRGVWYVPPLFGSIGYVSINLPRAAFVSRDDKDLFENLRHYMEVARKYLNVVRARHERFYEMGYYPLTKMLAEADGLTDVNVIERFYYSTIATIGLAEAVNILILKERDDYARESKEGFITIWHLMDGNVMKDVIYWNRKILTFMNDVLREFEREDGRLYNLEEAPAETASIRFAELDLRTYGKAIEPYVPRDVDLMTGRTEYFYTSQITPPYCTAILDVQIAIEAECQRLYTGGVVKLLHVHTPFWSPEWSRSEQIDGLERLSKLIRRIMDAGVIYMAFTPVQNHCNECGYLWIGEHAETCPKCGSRSVDAWSRVVGYYRPVRHWNRGRRAEFTTRQRFKVL